MLPEPEPLKQRLDQAVPGGVLEWLPAEGPSGQGSFLIHPDHALAVARFLRDDDGLRLDYLSNATGVDWPERVEKEKVVREVEVDGEVTKKTETIERTIPGCLEAVYHLFSMSLRHGPVILRMRTGNRTDQVALPSLTPVWRSAEFQEREIYDLYGIRFEGHPDLRRILMWDGYEDHPMRRDYREPDDFEYEPTPHGEVMERAKAHYPEGEEQT